MAKCGDDGKVKPLLNIDMVRVPPCHDCLVQHIKLVNYQVAVWKKADIADPEVPDPTDAIWCWTERDILPLQLEEIGDEQKSDDDEDEEKIHYEDEDMEDDDDGDSDP